MTWRASSDGFLIRDVVFFTEVISILGSIRCMRSSWPNLYVFITVVLTDCVLVACIDDALLCTVVVLMEDRISFSITPFFWRFSDMN